MKKLLLSLLALSPVLAAAEQQPEPGAGQQAPDQQQPPAQQQPAPPPQPPYQPPPQPPYQPPPPPPYQPPPPPPGYAPPPYPPPPYQPPPPGYPPPRPGRAFGQRDSWYIGFGLGWGDGRISYPSSFSPSGSFTFGELLRGFDPVNVSLNFKVGATLNPRMLLGLDITGVRSQGSAGGIDRAIQVSNYDAMFTFFPAERGFFLRGGAGLATLAVEDSFSGDQSYTGFGVVGGAGYAFWLGRSFNLTLNLDLSAQWYGSNAPDNTRLVNIFMGFDWY